MPFTHLLTQAQIRTALPESAAAAMEKRLTGCSGAAGRRGRRNL
jgi:hypothetical protein